MRALHVVSTLDRGGIAASLRQLLPVLVECEGVGVEVAILYGESQYQAEMAALGISLHHLKLTSKYDGRGVGRLARLFGSGRFQVIHAHGWPAVLLVALASLLASGPRFVLTEHNVTNRRRQWRLKFIDRFVYSRFHSVVAVSEAAADALIAWLPQVHDRIVVIYNGLDTSLPVRGIAARTRLRTELGLDEQTPVILFSGSLEYRKGPDILLHSLAHLEGRIGNEESSPIRPLTLIAGEGYLGAELRRLAVDLKLSEQVRFLGFRPDLTDVMAAADLFVVASRWEGCPMAVLEAMAMELPIVATSVGGVPEVIEDGESGVLVPAADALALGQAISQLLANRPLARHLGRMARRRVLDYFTVEQSGQALAAVYQHSL